MCLDESKDPRLLACLHSLCRECIDRLAMSDQHRTGGVKCPVCRTECPVPASGATGLAKDILSASSKMVTCDVCEGHETTAWCASCEVLVCSDHVVQHMSSGQGKSKKEHIFHFSTSPEQARQQASASRCLECSEHQQPLVYFCVTCSTPVCGECVLFGRHKGHAPRKAAEFVEEKRQKVAAGIQQIRRTVEPCVERSIQSVDDVTAQLKTRAEQVSADIQAAIDRAVGLVQACGQKLLQEVEDLEHDANKVLGQQHDDLEHQLSAACAAAQFGERVMEKVTTDSCAALPLLAALESRMDTICEEDVIEQPRKSVNFTFRPPQEEKLMAAAVEAVGVVISNEASAELSTIEGSNTQELLIGEAACITVTVKDETGTPLNCPGSVIKTQWLSVPEDASPSASLTVQRLDLPGQYELSTSPSVTGEYCLQVCINGVEMKQPVTFRVTADRFDIDECHPRIALSDDRRTAMFKREGPCQASVLGSVGMRRGSHSWKIRIGTAHWHAVGIAAKPLSSKSANYDESHSWSSSKQRYGRPSSHDSDPLTNWKDNDCLQLVLNCDEHTLQMTNLRSQESHIITGLPDAEFFVYVNMYKAGNSATFM